MSHHPTFTFQNIYLAKIFTFTYIYVGFTLNESLKYNKSINKLIAENVSKTLH